MRGTRLRVIATLGITFLVTQACGQDAQILKTDKDKVNYGLGVGVGRNFERQGIEVDVDMMVRGLKDALAGRKLLMTDEELQAVMTKFGEETRQKQTQTAKEALTKNKKAGDAFLAANKLKPGVVTLPSGLQYKILKAGAGGKPTDLDTVECIYRGTLVDGTEFDTSSQMQKPATFAIKDVIPGWKEALKLMSVGSKWQLVVPPELAYQDRGYGDIIGPGATIVFEIELLAIK